MPSIQRIIHDNYATLANHIGHALVPHETAPESHVIATFQVQQSGTHQIKNHLEHSILPDEPGTLSFSWNDANGYHLKNCYLAEDYGHIFFTQTDHLAFNTGTLRLKPKKVRRPIKTLKRIIDQPALHLCGPNHDNHGHFILDYIPRLLAYRQHLTNFEDFVILIPGKHCKTKLHYLTLAGIPQKRILFRGDGTTLCRELVYIPILNGPQKLAAPSRHLQTAEVLTEKTHNTNDTPTLFISRSDAPNKKVSNEKELIDITRQLADNVEVLHLSKLSFSEQIQKFRNTPLIIGSVGQALTNLLFTSGKKVLILTPEHAYNERSWGRAYHMLASLSGNHPITLKAQEPVARNANWEVPTELFEHTLKALINFNTDE